MYSFNKTSNIFGQWMVVILHLCKNARCAPYRRYCEGIYFKMRFFRKYVDDNCNGFRAAWTIPLMNQSEIWEERWNADVMGISGCKNFATPERPV